MLSINDIVVSIYRDNNMYNSVVNIYNNSIICISVGSFGVCFHQMT